MLMVRRSRIVGTGGYVPARVVTNEELAGPAGMTPAAIYRRTGIRERRWAAPDEATSDLALQATTAAIGVAGVRAAALDAIILSTTSPDTPMPSSACHLQRMLGAKRAFAFDLAASCSGFLYALSIGDLMIRLGQADLVLVAAAEVKSRYLDFRESNTAILFGDGAGAAVLQNRPNAHGLLTAVMGADGRKADLLFMAGGGSRCPATAESVASGMHYLRMEGKETFKNAVQAMQTAAEEALRRCEIDISRIKCLIPHQANRRIIDAVLERLGAKPEQLFVNLHKYGNTSAASVAIALDEAVASGRVQRGDLILMVVFGAGLTWGAAVIEW